MKQHPTGRTLAEFKPLKPAEAQLLEACKSGLPANLGDSRPSAESKANTVRANFLRFLALGGSDEAPIHEHGIQLSGAWVKGTLDLTNATVPTSLAIRHSHFDSRPVLNRAEVIGAFSLVGSQVPGLGADGLVCHDDVFLRGGFTATGQVRLRGAQIGGNLECSGAKLEVKDGDALSADGAVIKGSVFLDDGFTASGQVRLLGAQIGGDLACRGAKLEVKDGNALSADRTVIKGSVFLNNGFTATGTVRMLGAQIGSDLACEGATFQSGKGRSFGADGLVVNGGLVFRKLTRPAHRVSLSSARVSRLVDDADAWGDDVVLDGFVYEHISGGAPTDAATRLAWLKKQPKEHCTAASFRPQPWRQLQQVLRNMGHAEDARQVAIALEDHLRANHLIGQTPQEWPAWQQILYRSITRGLHAAFGGLMGYGYRPMRLGAWMVGVWLVCAAVYWAAALQGVMGPSNPLAFQNPNYTKCTSNWYLCAELPEEYTGFSPLVYSLDVLLPVVNLQQEQDWAPLIPTPKATWDEELFDHWTFKHVVRLFVWFEIMFGWVASLLLVAVLSGLTKRRDE